MKRIYLDNAATTPVDPEVIEAMAPFMRERFGNPSSPHFYGREAREAVESAALRIGKRFGAEPYEVCFTSGGTESNNLAIKGVALSRKGCGIITQQTEHKSVLEAVGWLSRNGWEAEVLPVDKQGMLDPEKVREKITPKTRLVSVMHANNEIGTVQRIREIKRACEEEGVLLHVDAVQSFGKIEVSIEMADLISVSAHKINGPKGAGCLIVREGVRLSPLIHGGLSGHAARSGTLNVAGIVGLAKACEISTPEKYEEVRKRTERFVKKILANSERSWLNGHPEMRVPGIANITFRGIEADSLVARLDKLGVCCSTGSACTEAEKKASDVLKAIGLSEKDANSSVRFSVGIQNTDEELEEAAEIVAREVNRIRELERG